LRKESDVPNIGRGQHWSGNAEVYLLIGHAAGEEMKELLIASRR
jgi:hypothetical protein